MDQHEILNITCYNVYFPPFFEDSFRIEKMQIDCNGSSFTSQHNKDNNISPIISKKINHPSALSRSDPLRGTTNNIEEENSDLEESVDVMSQASSNSGLQHTLDNTFSKMNDLELG